MEDVRQVVVAEYQAKGFREGLEYFWDTFAKGEVDCKV